MKTRRGKIIAGSFGVRRKKNKKRNRKTSPGIPVLGAADDQTVKETFKTVEKSVEETVEQTSPPVKEAEKKAARKKAAPKAKAKKDNPPE